MSNLAPDQMTGRDDDATQIPDQQAASGQSYGGQSSLLSTISGLGGSGSIPPEIIMGLMPPPRSTLGNIGSALSLGASAMGNTPDLGQQIRQNTQKESMGIMDMMMRMQNQTNLHRSRQEELHQAGLRLDESKRQHAEQKADGQMKMLETMMSKPDVTPAFSAYAQKEYARISEQRWGIPVPPAILHKTMDAKQRDTLAINVWRTMPRDEQGQLVFDPAQMPQILRGSPLASVEDVQGFVAILNKPLAAASFNIKTDDDLKEATAKRITAESQALDSMMPPGFPRNAAGSATMHAMAEELFPDVAILDLDAKQRKRITNQIAFNVKEEKAKEYEGKQDQKLQHGLAMLGAKNEFDIAKAIELAEIKRKNATLKPVDWKAVTRELEPYVGLSNGVRKLEFLERTLDKMPANAFPEDTAWGRSAPGRFLATQMREKLLGGDAAVVEFQAEVMNVMNGVVARKWLDDKNSRVWESQRLEYQTIQNLPPKAAIKSLLKRLQEEMTGDMRLKYNALEATGIAPDALLKGARNAMGRVDPSMKEAQPPSPLAPQKLRRQFWDMRPGSKNYNKAVWLNFDVGDKIDPGYVEIKD